MLLADFSIWFFWAIIDVETEKIKDRHWNSFSSEGEICDQSLSFSMGADSVFFIP